MHCTFIQKWSSLLVCTELVRLAVSKTFCYQGALLNFDQIVHTKNCSILGLGPQWRIQDFP